MKALLLTLLNALLFALLYSPVHAAIPAPTRTPTAVPAAQPASAGAFDAGTAILLLFVAGVFLAGVIAVVLVRRGAVRS